MINASGAEDATADASLLNADYAFIKSESDEYATIIAVKDNYPVANEKPAYSQSVSIYTGGEYEALYEVISDRGEAQETEDVWAYQDEIGFRKTAVITDENKMDGYSRIFSGAIVTDEYGYSLQEDKIDLIITTSPNKDVDGYEYCKSLHQLTVNIYE